MSEQAETPIFNEPINRANVFLQELDETPPSSPPVRSVTAAQWGARVRDEHRGKYSRQPSELREVIEEEDPINPGRRRDKSENELNRAVGVITSKFVDGTFNFDQLNDWREKHFIRGGLIQNMERLITEAEAMRELYNILNERLFVDVEPSGNVYDTLALMSFFELAQIPKYALRPQSLSDISDHIYTVRNGDPDTFTRYVMAIETTINSLYNKQQPSGNIEKSKSLGVNFEVLKSVIMKLEKELYKAYTEKNYKFPDVIGGVKMNTYDDLLNFLKIHNLKIEDVFYPPIVNGIILLFDRDFKSTSQTKEIVKQHSGPLRKELDFKTIPGNQKVRQTHKINPINTYRYGDAFNPIYVYEYKQGNTHLYRVIQHNNFLDFEDLPTAVAFINKGAWSTPRLFNYVVGPSPLSANPVKNLGRVSY